MTPSIHDRFIENVNLARKYYHTVDLPNVHEARSYLESVIQVIKPISPLLGIEWLKSEIASLYHPAVVADYEFPLDLLEYCFRSLHWKEGKDLLVELFNEMKNPSFRLKLELMIKRYYDPHWDGGNCEFTDLGPSIWDLVERGA